MEKTPLHDTIFFEFITASPDRKEERETPVSPVPGRRRECAYVLSD
jgi:hypothetical protein